MAKMTSVNQLAAEQQQQSQQQSTTNSAVDNDLSSQQQIISQLIKSHEPMKENQVWCLIELKWFQSWKRYVGYKDVDMDDNEATQHIGIHHPGPIDNSTLLLNLSDAAITPADGAEVGVADDLLQTINNINNTESGGVSGDGDEDGDVAMNQAEQEATTTTTATSSRLSFYQKLQKSRKNDPFLRKLMLDISDHIHYDLVPQEAFQKLASWYGGGPEVARRAVVDHTGGVIVEMHPHFVFLLTNKGMNMVEESLVPIETSFSRFSTMKQMISEAKKLLGIEENEEVQLWRAMNCSPYDLVTASESDEELDTVNSRQNGQQYIIEVKQDGEWVIKNGDIDTAEIQSKTTGSSKLSAITAAASTSSSSYLSLPSSYSSRSTSSYLSSRGGASSFSNEGDGTMSDPGVCGLQNLGNTCFMNSALQCLTKTPQINQYFVNGSFKPEINESNPLGMGGKIASAFGNLMQEMWSGKNSYVNPREFKYTIGKFAPQFSGYQQQDSQELIAYLLDGLHEDLNRILKKPVTEAVVSNGREDAVVAAEAWENHKKRNDSIIVDKFQGQLKSTLVCPQCESVSVTFDPYMYLSLPLPVETTRTITVTVFKRGESPTKYAIKVPKHAPISEFRAEIASMVGVTKVDHIVIVEIFSNKVYRYISDQSGVHKILENDVIHAYVLDESVELPENIHTSYGEYSSPFASTRIFSRQEEQTKYAGTTTRSIMVGAPFVLPFDKKVATNKELYDFCFEYVKPFLAHDVARENGLDLDGDRSAFLPDAAFAQKNKKKKKQDTYSYNHSSYSSYDRYRYDDDQMKDQEDDQEEKQEDSETSAAEQQKFVLFTLKFEEGSSYSSYSNDDNDDILPYTNDVVKVPNDRYSNDKKSLQMYINPNVLEKLFDVNRINHVEFHSSTSSQNAASGVTLNACLERFTTQEKLGEDDAWYCPKCKEFVQATKKFDIWTIPEVLVIHLKRFQYNKYTRDKLDTYVDYPLDNFDLGPHILSTPEHNTKYELFAVSNHYGGLGGGHYTAYAKVQDNQWYKFDDSYVQRCRPEDSQTSAGYVLFYARKE